MTVLEVGHGKNGEQESGGSRADRLGRVGPGTRRGPGPERDRGCARQDETEADRIGAELAARAGFDPRAAITLWQKMEQKGGGSSPEFLSTHPAGKTRIADLRVISEKVLPLYEGARVRR
ncbi:MAG: M48 family metalloprotease [Acidobacteria bacterium]|nr:M48 family metalloprotease [Acidobacteriota bacterium]